MSGKKGQILAACAITYPQANPDSLRIGFIASFAMWRDNMPQSPVLWMMYPPASTSHPKKDPISNHAVLLGAKLHLGTRSHAAVPAQAWRSWGKTVDEWRWKWHSPQNCHMECVERGRSSSCRRLCCSDMVLPAARREQRAGHICWGCQSSVWPRIFVLPYDLNWLPGAVGKRSRKIVRLFTY